MAVKQFAVIGLGRFGSSVARTLYELGHEVLGIDSDADNVQSMSGALTHVVQADATEEDVLRRLGIRNFDVVVVAIGHDIQASVLITLMLKELGVKYVVAKAASDLHGKVLSKIGADRVVYPERDMGIRVAHNLIASNVLDYIELAPEYSIVEMTAGENLAGKSLKELNLRARYGINVMALKRGNEVKLSPGPEDTIATGDVIVLVGPSDELAKIETSRIR